MRNHKKNIKNCSIFGHRKININIELIKNLFKTFKKLILQGYTNFYFGGFGEFDTLCYKIITKLKRKYTFIIRIYCLEDKKFLKPKYNLDKSKYEKYVYLDISFDYWYSRLYYRNCAMINLSDSVVFYVEERKNSGAYKAYKYAKLKKKNIINLYS